MTKYRLANTLAVFSVQHELSDIKPNLVKTQFRIYLGTLLMDWRLLGLLPGVERLLQAPWGLCRMLHSLSTSLPASTASLLLDTTGI